MSKDDVIETEGKVIEAIKPIIASVIKTSARVKPIFFIFTRLSLLNYYF